MSAPALSKSKSELAREVRSLSLSKKRSFLDDIFFFQKQNFNNTTHSNNTQEDADDFVIPQKYAMIMMMFQMASGGKNTITLPQIVNMAAMPLQMGMAQFDAAFDSFVGGPMAMAPPPVQALVKKYVGRLKNNVMDDFDKLLQPIFSIVDGNDSGTISKREFFHLARLGEIVKSMQGQRGPPNAAQIKEILDAVYDLVDINGDGAIAKDEIAALLQRVLVGFGKLPQALIQMVSDTLDQEFFDAVAKTGYDFLPMLKGAGVDITDEKGNILYVLFDHFYCFQEKSLKHHENRYSKCAPFLAMADGALKAKAQEAMARNASMKGSIDTYVKVETMYLGKLDKLADSDGNITKEDYMSLLDEMAGLASAQFKDQFTAILAGVPRQQQQIAMLVSGFVDPPSILKDVIMTKPFVFERTISALFDNFGTKGKINTGSLRTLFNMFAGSVDTRVTTTDPSARLKAVFDLLDADSDGALSPNEVARVLCGLCKVTFAMAGEMIMFYLRLFTSSKLVSGLLSAAEAASASGATGPLKLNFPVKRIDIDAMLAKLGLGGAGGGLGSDAMSSMKAIFDHCDKDQDGMLTFEEFNTLEARVGKAQFAAMCSMGGDPNKVDFNIFKMQYDNGVNLGRDVQLMRNQQQGN